jgi:hypothetical protein
VSTPAGSARPLLQAVLLWAAISATTLAAIGSGWIA